MIFPDYDVIERRQAGIKFRAEIAENISSGYAITSDEVNQLGHEKYGLSPNTPTGPLIGLLKSINRGSFQRETSISPKVWYLGNTPRHYIFVDEDLDDTLVDFERVSATFLTDLREAGRISKNVNRWDLWSGF